MNEFNVDALQSILSISMWIALKVSMPYLIGSFLFGILVSILQSAMQLQDPTINFVPKILILFLLSVVLGPYVLNTYTDYLTMMFKEISLVR
ncbi:MAG: flagellar biosynthetic protein FliQ [Planctomycetota bacterium]